MFGLRHNEHTIDIFTVKAWPTFVLFCNSKYQLIKVTGCTLMGKKLHKIYYASFPNEGQLIEERICSHRGKFFPSG